nr:hypothetical protein [Sinorhizobium americanum]
MNGHTNLAIFDRAVSKLSAVCVVPLIGAPGPCHYHQRSSREPHRRDLTDGPEDRSLHGTSDPKGCPQSPK